MTTSKKVQRRERFDYERMKAAATSADPAVRKKMFVEYFEEFQEFPSYLFDTEREVDSRLLETIHDIIADPATTSAMRKGVEALTERLPYVQPARKNE